MAAILAAKNPLLEAAQPLLRFLADLPPDLNPERIPVMRNLVSREVSVFQSFCADAKIDHAHAVAASFAIGTALDEAIHTTEWGGTRSGGGDEIGAWASQGLAAEFHGDTAGGDKVFLLIGRIAAAPAEHIHLIEVMFMILGLGFEGRFAKSKHGQLQLKQIRTGLFNLLEEAHGTPPEALSPHGRDVTAIKFRPRRGVPVWVSALVLSLVCLGMYSWFQYQLDLQSAAVIARIRAVGALGASPGSPTQKIDEHSVAKLPAQELR